MPKLELALIIDTPPDPDGDTTRVRKTVDAWGNLTEAQKTALTAIYDRVKTAIHSRYGETAEVESALYVGDV